MSNDDVDMNSTWSDDNEFVLNIDELAEKLKSIEKKNENALLPLIMNLKKIQQSEQYVNSKIDEEILPIVEFNDVDVDVIDASISVISTTFIFVLSTKSAFFFRRQSVVDTSEFIEHERVRTSTLTSFDVALSFWCEETDISRNQYDDLYEMLNMFKFHVTLNSFSESLTTLKRHTKNKFFILSMRKKLINLISEKQSTAAENRKQVDSKLIFTKDLVFFDFRINIQKNWFYLKCVIHLKCFVYANDISNDDIDFFRFFEYFEQNAYENEKIRK